MRIRLLGDVGSVWAVVVFSTTMWWLLSCDAFMTTTHTTNRIRSMTQQQQQPLTGMSSRRLFMVSSSSSSSSTDSSSSSSKKKEELLLVNNNNKYPTKRGETVDSRQIVAGGLGRTNLRAVRLNHILFASEELADASLARVRSSDISFESLAQQISNCAETRDSGGQVGWVNLASTTDTDNNDTNKNAVMDGFYAGGVSADTNQHLDAILPEQARLQTFQLSTKPGDIIMATSERGYHLVQIVDVMVDVRKMAQLKTRNKLLGVDQRKKNKQTQTQTQTTTNSSMTPRGILGGALLDRSLLEEEEEGVVYKTDLTYKMETMGCQMNMADSERMEGQLQSLGLRRLNDDDKTLPDLVVLNTCSIRDHAEQKVYSYIGPYAKAKREGKDVTIIVAGCVAQQEGQNLLRRAPEVDLVMGPQYANRLADLLEDVSQGNQVVATEASHIMEDSTKPRRSSTTAAWVNVIYGCNERCTYCIVPTTRGVEQSRPIQSILHEVSSLISQGYQEVTLLGQNIDAYGRDMIPKRRFSDLLRLVGAVPGLKRLRFVTSHPRYMSLGVIDAVADTPTACWNFHIPFQSGNDDVLANMGRGHTRKKYLQIVQRIRDKLPDAAITADVIVGFPGETEDQFQDTLSLMEEVIFDSVNTAAYSPRPNTPAATWQNQCTEEDKQSRLRRINALNLQHAAQRRLRMLGRTHVEVLVEERNVKQPTQVMGRTTHGYIVYMDGDIDTLRGKLVHVTIDDCQTYYLTATITSILP